MTIKFNAKGIVPTFYLPSKHVGGNLDPDLIILHDTAGSLESGSSVRWLRDNPAKTSAHFVVERDGSFTQLVPVTKVAHHAGKSNYHGRPGCNAFSIGIEIVNPGKMQPVEGGTMAQAWWGQIFDPDGGMGIERMHTAQHGDGFWMPYTEQQIETVEMLIAMLLARFPKIRDIRAHWYVSPGRKVDTNPLFPMEALRARMLGRDEPEPVPDEFPQPEREMASVNAGAFEALNLRRWPSFNPNVIAQIPHGTMVPVLSRGSFGGTRWSKVIYGGYEGWVVSRYLLEIGG